MRAAKTGKVFLRPAVLAAILFAFFGVRLTLNLQAGQPLPGFPAVASNPEYLAMGRSLSVEGRMRVAFDPEAHSARRAMLYPAALGPATMGMPLPLPATQASPGNTNSLVAALNSVAASTDPRRIFPLYSNPFTDPLSITGFIAAEILAAANTGGGGSNELNVTIEPAFIVHFTATTAPGEMENTYIHKLRLVQ